MPCIYAVPLPIGRDLRGTTTTRENRAQVIKDSPRPDVFAADKAVGQNFAAGIDNDEIGDSAAHVFLQGRNIGELAVFDCWPGHAALPHIGCHVVGGFIGAYENNFELGMVMLDLVI